MDQGDDLGREIIESLDEYRSSINAAIFVHIVDGFCRFWPYEKSFDPIRKILDKICKGYFDRNAGVLRIRRRERDKRGYKVLPRPLAWIYRRCSAYSPDPDLLPYARRGASTLSHRPNPDHIVQATVNDEMYTLDNAGPLEK